MTELIVDLGGTFHTNEKTSVNIDPNMKPDIVCDITCDLQKFFQLGSIDRIQCVHTLEHLFPGDYAAILKYWRKFLKPKGTLLVVVPDMDGLMRDCASNAVMIDVTLSIIYTLGHPFGTHKWGWSWETLKRDLTEAGYSNIKKDDVYPKYWIYNFAGYEYTGAVGNYRVPNLCMIGENNE